MCILSPATIYATSAQLELTEPVLIPDNRVHGTAFYGALLGSDVYDSAGNLSATFTAGTVQRGHLYFFGDIYTWVRNVLPTQFQPRRVIYTIEPGYFLVRDRDAFRLFIKHHSYHDVDFSDGINEAYELYGAGWQRAGNPEYSVRIGKYLNERSVDYDWDISGAVTGIVGDSDGRPVMLISGSTVSKSMGTETATALQTMRPNAVSDTGVASLSSPDTNSSTILTPSPEQPITT